MIQPSEMHKRRKLRGSCRKIKVIHCRIGFTATLRRWLESGFYIIRCTKSRVAAAWASFAAPMTSCVVAMKFPVPEQIRGDPVDHHADIWPAAAWCCTKCSPAVCLSGMLNTAREKLPQSSWLLPFFANLEGRLKRTQEQVDTLIPAKLDYVRLPDLRDTRKRFAHLNQAAQDYLAKIVE